jgi:NitT/TauT family transport system permease protein
MRARLNYIFESAGGLVLAFAMWELVVRLFNIPRFILPAPTAVFAEAYSKAGILLHHSLSTLSGTAVSLVLGALLGILVGLIIGYSRTASRLFFPLLGGFHALPMSAFIPIFTVWFGLGAMPKVIAGVLIAFFPIAVNVVTGLRTIEPELWEMMRALKATKAQVFLKVGLPRAVPYFFASLKVAAAGAFIGNVVGEMLASGEGLGYVLILATNQLAMALAFAALTILLLLGIVMFLSFDALEKRVAPWAFRNDESSTVGATAQPLTSPAIPLPQTSTPK